MLGYVRHTRSFSRDQLAGRFGNLARFVAVNEQTIAGQKALLADNRDRDAVRGHAPDYVMVPSGADNRTHEAALFYGGGNDLTAAHGAPAASEREVRAFLICKAYWRKAFGFLSICSL